MADKQSQARDERAERLAAALRENLKKRKERVRGVRPDHDTDREA
jgi:hypothetical protein